MKKFTKYLITPFIVLVVFSFNGCILDAFNTLTQEIPYTVNVNVSGTETTIERSLTVNLDDNNFYADNRSKINQIRLVKIAYKTKFVSPTDLEGNITLHVLKNDGTTIFSKQVPNAQPAAYLTEPYQLNLTETEIQTANLYFGQVSNRQFTAILRIDNLPAGTKTLEAQIFAVFEMDYDL